MKLVLTLSMILLANALVAGEYDVYLDAALKEHAKARGEVDTSTVKRWGADLYLMGVSKHFSNNYYTTEAVPVMTTSGLPLTYEQKHTYNSFNPGIGVGVTYNVTDYMPNWSKSESIRYDAMVTGGTYYDSMKEVAGYFMPGFRVTYGNLDGWHTGVSASFGAYKGSGFDGIGGNVLVSGGYKRVDLCLTCAPTPGGMVGAFVKIHMLDW